MSFIRTVREAARQEALRGIDDWYYQSYPYVLELRGRGPAIPLVGGGGAVFFHLPLGPEEYDFRRVFRQSIDPTVGGLVIEEDGFLWAEIRVKGTFGLDVKTTTDTTTEPEPAAPAGFTTFVGGSGRSGPGWTRRMLRNIFDRYNQLKANPQIAPNVDMVWHDMRTSDHWVIIPESVAIMRSKDRRSQHPYEIMAKAVQRAENQTPRRPQSSIGPAGVLSTATSAVSQGLALVNAAVTQASQITGEVRTVVQQIDSVVGQVEQISTAAQSFVDGVTSTIELGRTFVRDVITSLNTQVRSMEASASIPIEVRQLYEQMLDGLHQIGAQSLAYQGTYTDEASNVASVEGGAASDSPETLAAAAAQNPPSTLSEAAARREQVEDQELVDIGATNRPRLVGSYTATRTYAVRAFDTLEGIAARELGDGALWYDLAIINRLNYPYISETRIAGTVGPGDVIAIPVVGAQNPSLPTGPQNDFSLLGVDLALTETPNSGPGRPEVDLQIDPSTRRDVRLARGIESYADSLQLRIWTERGRLPLFPDYGLRRQIGVRNNAALLTLLRLGVEEAVRGDSRTARVARISFEASNDVVEIDLTVVPIGFETAQSVSVSLL